MQRVIRRTILAERQASRRLAKRKDKLTREWAKTNREQNNYNRKDETSLLKQVRKDRREDWELGPLAPRRDVGDKKDTYGTVSSQRLQGPILEHKDVDEALEPFGGRYLNIVKGDRVVLLEGRDKGKIGKITNVNTKRVECTVEGLNMVCTPDFPSIFFQLVIKANTLCCRWMLPSPNI
jgi:large subunit ribosomal protein L24